MPQLDPSIFPTQVFWLLLTFVPLYLILRRVVLPRIGDVLEARQRHIDADLEKAGGLKEEADAVLAEYEKALAEARAKATAALKRASDEMAADAAKRHEAFGRELAERVKQAETRIVSAKQEALTHLRSVATDVAAAATAKLIGVEAPSEEVEQAVEDALGSRG